MDSRASAKETNMATENMATSGQTGSAKIYQFPVRGRFAAHLESEAAPKVLQAAHTVVGGAWYHDEAIEAEGLRKSS
jgi:hypothetical protein